MGNTGSLALGGLLGFLALATSTEMWLPLICAVFVAEVVSVILQIASFKTLGRRVLLCAPLHHHFEFQGWAETKIVRRFCLAAAGCAALAIVLNLAGAAMLQSLADAKSANLANRDSTSRHDVRVSSLPPGGMR